MPSTSTCARVAAVARPLPARADAELVALLRAGRTEALAEIDRRYRPLMLAVARPLLAGTGFEPEDAVQDALVRALRALAGQESEPPLRPWLITVVRNRALDLRRRRENSVEALPHELVAPAADPVDAIVRRETLGRTVAGLRSLPPRQRQALVGQAFEGASHAELALRLDVTVPAVKALVTRARHGLAAAA